MQERRIAEREREREREREKLSDTEHCSVLGCRVGLEERIYMYVYIYVYIHTYIYIHIQDTEDLISGLAAALWPPVRTGSTASLFRLCGT